MIRGYWFSPLELKRQLLRLRPAPGVGTNVLDPAQAEALIRTNIYTPFHGVPPFACRAEPALRRDRFTSRVSTVVGHRHERWRCRQHQLYEGRSKGQRKKSFQTPHFAVDGVYYTICSIRLDESFSTQRFAHPPRGTVSRPEPPYHVQFGKFNKGCNIQHSERPSKFMISAHGARRARKIPTIRDPGNSRNNTRFIALKCAPVVSTSSKTTIVCFGSVQSDPSI